tara:strand:+ start:51 stop:1040 length:990 start_codon:yes stop_codon:yes gene_type:complete
MPIPTTFYYDSANFADATNIWDDADLTTPSADGWYQVGGVNRQILAGVLGPVQPCPSCVVPCDTTLTASGGVGLYYVGFDAGVTTGAVVVKFNPYAIPDQLTWVYEQFGVAIGATEYSSSIHGYKEGLIGAVTQASALGITNSLGSNGVTYNGVYYAYDLSLGTFIAQGNSVTLGPYLPESAGGVGITYIGYAGGTAGNQAFMVIPKTDPTSSLIKLYVEGPSTGTEWEVTVYCPKNLNKFSGGIVGATCTAPSTILYWTCSVEPGGDGTNTILGVHDWVFLDPNGETSANTTAVDIVVPIVDGDGVSKCVTISSDGVITNIGSCTGTC